LNTALLRGYASYSVTDNSWAAKREWGMMSAVVLGGAYVVTNIFSVFEDMTAALGALLVTTVVLIFPPVYLLSAARLARGGDASVESGEGAEGGGGDGIGRGGGDGKGGVGGEGGGLGTATWVGLYLMILFGMVVIPMTVWGAMVRLIHDAQDTAPPFSCGPCVTQQCIEQIKNVSSIAMLAMRDPGVATSAR